MKKEELEKFRTRLIALRQQIGGLVKGVEETMREGDDTKGYSQHQADEGTQDFDRTISLEITNREYSVLKQIDRALEKISDGTYGVCDLTGEDIPRARLDAVPYATMTVKAQERLEKGML